MAKQSYAWDCQYFHVKSCNSRGDTPLLPLILNRAVRVYSIKHGFTYQDRFQIHTSPYTQLVPCNLFLQQVGDCHKIVFSSAYPWYRTSHYILSMATTRSRLHSLKCHAQCKTATDVSIYICHISIYILRKLVS